MSGSRLWMILAFILFVISVALSVYVIVKEMQSDDSCSAELTKEADILDRFGPFFRTEEEQKALEKRYEDLVRNGNRTQAPLATNFPTGKCNITCLAKDKTQSTNRTKRSVPQLGPRSRTSGHEFSEDDFESLTSRENFYRSQRSKRQASQPVPNYHGCCISTTTYITPDNAKTFDGRLVELVQFKKEQQYFPSEICWQALDCNGCKCHNQPVYVTAVVWKDGKIGCTLDQIELKGCCKCFNI